MRERHVAGLALGLALLASACTDPSNTQTRPTAGGTVERVTVGGVRGHLEALQSIADRHGGTRAVGTSGYAASVEYVADVLWAAGYRVELPATDVPVFEQLEPSELELLEPDRHPFTDGVDFRAMLFSGSGDVQGHVTAVEGGCSEADFATFPDGDVALVEPGPCFRRTQAENARAAGASAVIGISTAAAGRPLRPTLLYPGGIEVPVLSVTAPVGRSLADGGAVVRIHVRATTSFRPARSVVADLASDDGAPVVMLGGHLDSVIDGPGINDNGSGVAVLLELARWLAGRDPPPAVRFGFWAGEEQGLYGSRDYVESRSREELAETRAYLNLDMVGSPNFVMFVYDDAAAASGSEEIARLFASFFEDEGLPREPIDLSSASDHAAFAGAGVPTGGLHTGALERKTSAQADVFGGAEHRPLDACYHQPCDTIENVSDEALRQTVDAVVYVLERLLEW